MPSAASPSIDLKDIEETFGEIAAELRGRFTESARVERAIRDNLRSLGYEV